MKRLFFLLALVTMLIPGFGMAQSNFTPSELDTLVSNIALYPDPLLVHVLTASTYGEQIPAANAWAQGHKNLRGESLAAAMANSDLKYDPSVQALLPFPTVLEMMNKYEAWCDQLGDAVTNQKDDVMEAIQRMRQAAYDHGHLRSNENVSVAEKSGNIVITPVKTEIVYVPVYNPRVVYYVYADGYTRITYGTGVWMGTWYGEWGWGNCWFDWGPRVIYVRNTHWHPHRHYPRHPRGYRPPPPRHEPRYAPRNNPPRAGERVVVRPAPSAPVHAAPTAPVHASPVHTAPAPARATATTTRPVVRDVPQGQRPAPAYRDDRDDDNSSTYGNRGGSSRNSEGRSANRVANPGGFGKVIRR